MKRALLISLLLVFCMFTLASCGLSATQIDQNLKENGFTTSKWTDEQIQESFGKLNESDIYDITSALYGANDEDVVLVVQLKSIANAFSFKDDLDEIIEDESIITTIEGRLVLIGTERGINLALGKTTSDEASK